VVLEQLGMGILYNKRPMQYNHITSILQEIVSRKWEIRKNEIKMFFANDRPMQQ
jgi:hypothetical protein